jgi:hypothetical protein
MSEKLTANQLYKHYKINGGNLKFSDWITTQKNNGIYPLNKELDSEVNNTLSEIDNDKNNKNTYQELYIIGAIFIVAIVVNKLMKNK